MLGLLSKYSPQMLEDENLPAKDDKVEVRASYMLHCLSYGASYVEQESLRKELINIVEYLPKPGKQKFIKEVVRAPNSEDLLMILALQAPLQAKVILKYAKHISDLSIIKILEHHISSRKKLMQVVASRRNIGETLIDYLVFRGDLQCIATLLNNERLSIPGKYLCEIFTRVLENEDLAIQALKALHTNYNNMKYLTDKLSKNNIDYIMRLYLDLNPQAIVYLANKCSYNGIIIFANNHHTKKLQGDIENLYKANLLSSNIIVKYLANGDLYSFCYALAKVCDISFQKVNDLLRTDPLSTTLQNIYSNARIEEDLIAAINDILEVVYASCLEQFLTNINFTNVLQDRYSIAFGHQTNSLQSSIKYLLNLID